MGTVMPHSELVRKAVEYIALEIKDMHAKGEDSSPRAMFTLVEKACLKFDLSPKEASMLHDFLHSERILP